MKYRRVLLKLSGESLMGHKQFGIDNQRLATYAKEIKNIYDQKIEVAIVIVATPTLIEKAATKAAKFRDLFFFIPKKNLKPTKSISTGRILNSFLSSLTVFKTSVFFIKIRVNLRNLGMR